MPNLIIMKGKPGVGKTALSDELAKKLNYPVIHKDEINDLVFPALGANKESSELVYKILDHFSEIILENGLNVIVDCSLSKKSHYEIFKKLAVNTKSRLFVIEVTLSDVAEVEKRLSNRVALPEHRIKKLGDISKQELVYEDYEVENVITIDNSENLDETTANLLAKLSI